MVCIGKYSVIVAAIAWALSFSPSMAEETEEREGGIIGTGIVGIINAIGSIHVNGQVIEFAPEFPITSPLGARDASSLKPGETVVVEAIRENDEWRAISIRHLVPLLGPSTLNSDNTISILGSSVVTSTGTIFEDTSFAEIAAGNKWLAVDGIWNGIHLIASYIREIDPRSNAQVTATYLGYDVSHDVYIGGIKIDNFMTKHLKTGEVVTISGPPDGNQLSAETITRGLFQNKLKRKLVEGFLSQPDEAGFYTIYGSGSIAYVSQSDAIMPNGRGVHCVIYDEDNQIKRVIDLPESFELRKKSFFSLESISEELCF